MTSQTVLLYLLKSILISGLFIAYYWIALRDKKFHYYNRFYLLSASVISLVAPLLNFNWFTVEEPVLYSSSKIIQFVIPTSVAHKSIQFGWPDYVLFFTGIISIALIGLLLMHILKIQLLKRKWDVTKMEGFDFINTNEDNAPFSFLNNLFWKQSISLQEEGGQQIFKHEITHIQQKHTWDRIYCQLVASVFWMNPFNWIIQKELVAIHEFIADEEAVGNSNVEAFAKMLLQTHYGNHFLNPTHSFFYSSIKRRLAMLTKSTNTKYSYLRRVMVLPVLIASVCLVSIKVHARERIERKVKEVTVSFVKIMSDTTKPINLVRVIQKLEVDTIKSVQDRNGNKIQIDDLKIQSVEGSEIQVNDVKLEVVDTALYKLNKNFVQPLYVIDGVPLKKSDVLINKISPTEIEAINILKDASSISLYGEAGKYGVVLITTKKGTKGNLQNKMEDVTVIGYAKKETKEGPAIFNAPKIQKNVDPNKNNDPIFYTAQKPAEFPGGSMGWIKYLERNLNRDLPVENGAPSGKYQVFLNFVVNSNGEVSNVLATNNPGYGTASEAIRIIEKGPKWIPAVQNGKNVNYLVKQLISFTVSAE
jgi:TonB-dependent SusC/RagA subfamily outer membrane receptor